MLLTPSQAVLCHLDNVVPIEGKLSFWYFIVIKKFIVFNIGSKHFTLSIHVSC